MERNLILWLEVHSFEDVDLAARRPRHGMRPEGRPYRALIRERVSILALPRARSNGRGAHAVWCVERVQDEERADPVGFGRRYPHRITETSIGNVAGGEDSRLFSRGALEQVKAQTYELLSTLMTTFPAAFV